MQKMNLLALARGMTRSLREQGQWVGYLCVLDALITLAELNDRGNRGDRSECPKAEVDIDPRFVCALLGMLPSSVAASLLPRRASGLLPRYITGAEVSIDVCQEVKSPGVYLTTSWAAARAAVALIGAADPNAVCRCFTDAQQLQRSGAIYLGESQAVSHVYPKDSPKKRSGIFSPKLTSAPVGSLIVVGPLDLAQYDLFDTAEKLHEACLLASEFGHRIIAVVRTPAPNLLLADLLRVVDLEECYDLEYVRSAIVGTVEADGHLSPRSTSRPRAGSSGPPDFSDFQEVQPFPISPTVESTFGICTQEPVSLPLEARSRLRARPNREHSGELNGGTHASRQAMTTPIGECSRKRPMRWRSRAELLTAKPLSRDEDFPDEFAELLDKGVSRRRAGILLLGGIPQSPERELMLAEALAATKATGPAAMVLPSYRSQAFDSYTQSIQVADGSSVTCSRRFPHIPMFPSVESAYANGCRRIAVEYECEPYPPLPIELLEEYADDVCFILCVDDVNCGDAFEWATGSTWEDLQRLICALCWSGFRGTRHAVSLYDAFVPGIRSMSATQYERPADAVRDGRQLRWERQALRLLDSDQVNWRQLRHHLFASGFIDPPLNFEAIEWSRTKEGLRDWLLAHLVSFRRSTSAPSASGRFH